MQASLGEPKTFSGTTAAQPGWTRVAITNLAGSATFARKITVKCEDASNDLNVSLDGGATSIKIVKGTERVFEGPLTNFSVQSAGAGSTTVAWSAIASVA